MNIGVILLAIINVSTIVFAIFLIRWFNRQHGVWNKVAVISTTIAILCLIAIWVLVFLWKNMNSINIQII